MSAKRDRTFRMSNILKIPMPGMVLFLVFCSALMAAGGALNNGGKGMAQAEDFLIDDFTRTDRRSALETAWSMFTDRVMGGASTAESGFDVLDGRRCLRLRGEVSLENNGGFIQVALPLLREGGPFDASDYTGVRLWVRGNGETYHIHLRTPDNQRPWQYYSGEFTAGEEWRPVEIPFAGFQPKNLRRPLDPSRLLRIALVAIEKEFRADVAAARLEFYR